MGKNMTQRTITRLDLSESLIREIGLPKTETIDLVEMVLDEISQAALRGEDVKISLFGTFSLLDKNPRIGRNPKTGEEKTISARRVMNFRPSANLRNRVNEGNLKKHGYT